MKRYGQEIEEAPWFTKQPRLYVMRRKDGWHKIGHCYGNPERRAKSMTYRTPHLWRPVEYVWSVKVSSVGVLTLEHRAHQIMLDAGFARGSETTDTEWFRADAKDCIKAIRAAIRNAPKGVTERMMRNFGPSGRQK